MVSDWLGADACIVGDRVLCEFYVTPFRCEVVFIVIDVVIKKPCVAFMCISLIRWPQARFLSLYLFFWLNYLQHCRSCRITHFLFYAIHPCTVPCIMKHRSSIFPIGFLFLFFPYMAPCYPPFGILN